MNTQLDQLATAVAACIAARQSTAEQAEAERQAKYAAAFDTIVAYLHNRWQGSGLEALIGPPTVVNGPCTVTVTVARLDSSSPSLARKVKLSVPTKPLSGM